MQTKQLHRFAAIIKVLKKQNAPIYKGKLISEVNKLSQRGSSTFNPLNGTKTLQRDLNRMREIYKLKDDLISSREGIELLDKNWNIPYLSLDKDEIQVSYLASAISGKLIPDNMRENYKTGLAAQGAAASENLRKYERLINSIDNQQLMAQSQPEVVNKIIESFLKNRQVSIQYFPLGKEGSFRTIAVDSFYIQEGGWYIRAYCFNSKRALNLALHRIKKCTITEEKFIPSEEIKEQLLKNRYSLQDPIKNIKIKCDEVASRLLKERTYFENSTLDEENSILNISKASTPAIIRWVLSMEGKVEVISPKELRDEVRKTAENLLQIHK